MDDTEVSPDAGEGEAVEPEPTEPVDGEAPETPAEG